ncbi:hypothetical protein [Pedococcus bigeumensis]|uniref:patatin-like phospholipase family protein n=1 Tax=Pedococcus bigeumensis TaxID=433644 RepID=UPI002FE847C3
MRADHARALVLAGGGAAGNAWEIGLVAGPAEGGVDLLAADLIVGTSAGSTVAAQITSGTSPGDLYAAVLAQVPRPRGGDGRPDGPRGPGAAGRDYVEWSDAIIATAVDARSGEPVVFDRESGIDLVDAVAASTGNGYPIGADRYLNGGYRRSENADLAMGFARVLVLSPFGGRTRMPLEWRMDLASQVEDLRAGGQPGRDRLPGRRGRRRVRRQRPGPFHPTAGRPRRPRAGSRAGGAPRRLLELTRASATNPPTSWAVTHNGPWPESSQTSNGQCPQRD